MAQLESALRAVRRDGRALDSLPPQLRCSPQLQLEALLAVLRSRTREPLLAALPQLLPRALSPGFAWRKLLERRELLRKLLREDGRNLALLPPELRDDWALALVASCARPNGARYASWRLRSCGSFMSRVMHADPALYRLAAPQLLRTDLSLLQQALRDGMTGALFYAREPLRSDRDAHLSALLHVGLRALPPASRTAPWLLSLAGEAGERIARDLALLPALQRDEAFQRELAARCPSAAALLPLAPPPTKRPRLHAELTCPVCLEVVRGSVRQCRHGHLFCSECVAAARARVFVCPVCRSAEAPEALSRSLIAEVARHC
jgi:hypothetical protein